MAAGFFSNGVCHSSLAAATSAHWTLNPVSVASGQTTYITDVSWSGTTWVIRKFSLQSGVLSLDSTTAAPSVSFEACDPVQPFKDGAEIGAGVAAAILIAYLIRILGWGTR